MLSSAGIVVVLATEAGAQRASDRAGTACAESFTISARTGETPVVTGATRLSTGTLVVLDGASRRLLYFDPAHLLPRTVPLPAAPNDSRSSPSGLPFARRSAGDTVVVFEANVFQMHVFTPEGTLARTVALNEFRKLPRYPSAVHVSALDGAIIAVTSLTRPSSTRSTSRDSVIFAWFDGTGKRIAITSAIEDVSITRDARRSVGSRSDTYSAYVGRHDSGTITPAATVTSGRGPLFHFEEARKTIAVYSRGALVRRIQLPSLRRDAAPGQAQRLQFRADLASRVWLEVPRDRSGSDRRWLVFSADGQSSDQVLTPADARVLEIGPDYLVLERPVDTSRAVSVCALPLPHQALRVP